MLQKVDASKRDEPAIGQLASGGLVLACEGRALAQPAVHIPSVHTPEQPSPTPPVSQHGSPT